MFNIIPAIDILGGKLVRLSQGDYDRVDAYSRSPLEMALAFEEMGARRIHLVDLDGARHGDLVNAEVIKEICSAVSCEIEMGGGIRDRARLERVLDWGVDFAIMGSVFATNIEMACKMIAGLESRVMVGVDVKDGDVAVNGWEEKGVLSVVEMTKALDSIDIEGIIFTDISKDGMMAGPSIDSIRGVSQKTRHGVIASGGVRGMADISALQQIGGVSGCIVGKALLSGAFKADCLWH